MNLKSRLVGIANVVAEEAAKNPEFRDRLLEAMADSAKMSRPSALTQPRTSAIQMGVEKRRGGRRSEALIDPVDLAGHGEGSLRARLSELDLERLHDIVAQYGMDPGKLVMKWKDRERVIERIVEVSMARATKGDAFRKE